MSSEFQILPPAWYECPECAVKHKREEPHDATSMFYQIKFLNAHKRPPTWADAMAHCEPKVQAAWTEQLTKLGIDINSTQVRGGIKSKEELDERLAAASENETTTGGEE